ncbi:MAG: hypothetical protein AAB250_03675 [Bdellovibrionota bacterium]
MTSSFEAEIQALLVSLSDPEKVADDLVRRWNLSMLSEAERRTVAEFFVAAGYNSTLLDVLPSLLTSNQKLPWAPFIEALGRSKIEPTAVEIEALFAGATEQDALADLVRSRKLDALSPRFNEVRADGALEREAELEKKKNDIMDKLQFLRANRLQEQEKQAIEEFKAIAPQDPQIVKEIESYDMRWAREVLSRRAPLEEASAEELLRRSERMTPEQEASKSLMVARTKELAKNDPRAAYDLALSLHFMDFNTEALEVLSVAPPSPSSDWLRIELMILARKFGDALAEASTLEARYASDPEAAFAITYARARALKGLGQGELATDLLRSLVRVRPSYKSAQSLLMEWSGGDE